ncbi:MAG TPA: hypothetical protein VHC69_00305 [Polyangiaceae bacterium]|nr:hypothetical protein [Polyangiaceae bacterium]
MDLSLGGGVTVNSVHYVLTGPNGFATQTGDIDVSATQTITKEFDNLPAGNGYTITLSATASDGSQASTTASFNIIAHETTIVNVHLQFRQNNRTGTAIVNGDVNVCPQIDSVAASPDAITVGGSTAITAVAHDLNGGPSPLSYSWTSTSGSFSNATGASPTFTSSVPGTATLTLTVSDGDCSDTWSIDVNVGTGGGTGGSTGAGGATGGTTGSGGTTTSSGGTTSAGGTTTTGGTTSSGGTTTSSGGTTTTGGTTSSGGTTTTTGGTTSSGGTTTTTGGTTSSGGTTATGGTTSSGGTTATGGTTSSGGSSGGGGFTTAEQLILQNRGADCLACAQDNAPGGPNDPNGAPGLLELDALTGVASAGPGAGTSNLQLALNELACIFPPRTTSPNSCAAGAVSDCYCGDSGSNCSGTTADGVCRSQIEAGTETTDFNTLAQQLANPALPGGLSVVLVRSISFGYNTLGDTRCGQCFQ